MLIFYIKSVNFTMSLSDKRPAVVKNELLTMKQPLGYWLIAASHVFIGFSNFHYALILQMGSTNFFMLQVMSFFRILST